MQVFDKYTKKIVNKEIFIADKVFLRGKYEIVQILSFTDKE